jgi:hypothetical protein
MLYIYTPPFAVCVFYMVMDALSYVLKQHGVPNKIIDKLDNITVRDFIIVFGYKTDTSVFYKHHKNKVKWDKLKGKKFVIYNFEQLHTKNWEFLINEYKVSGCLEVWDYSYNNTEILSKYNIVCKFLPLGYCKSYEIANANNNNSDSIIFVGTPNDRRLQIIKNINKNNNIVHVRNGFFGDYNNIVKANKVFLNIHYYTPALLELTRIVPLLSNKKIVISERSMDTTLDNMFSKFVLFYDTEEELVNLCMNGPINVDTYDMFVKTMDYKDIFENTGCLDTVRNTNRSVSTKPNTYPKRRYYFPCISR